MTPLTSWRLPPCGGRRRQTRKRRADIFFVDRDTSLPFQSYAIVNVDLQIGSNVGSVSVALTEKRKGSGRWLL